VRKPHQRWKPAGAVTIMDKDRLGTLFLYSRDGQPAVIGYRGRKTRPEIHVTMGSPSLLEKTAKRWLDGLREQHRTAQLHRETFQRDEWSRNNVMQRIRQALAARGFRYSVTGGRGTAWGWISIDLLPSDIRTMTPEQRREAYRWLNKHLGLTGCDGASVPASTAHYREYVERAEGKVPTKIAEAYWD